MARRIVICGGGSAGCVLAARLSEDSATEVTLLEAGPDYPTREEMPEAIRSAYAFGGPPLDWGFSSDGAPMPRGKVIGGSSAINGANAIRSLPVDFQRWQALGADQWGWEQVLPYFRKLEDDSAPGEWHGRGGPVHIRRFTEAERTPLTAAFIEAATAAGHPFVADPNGPEPRGVAVMAMNQRDGERLTMAVSYLIPEVRARPNLNVRGDALVDRVELDDGRAQAVLLASGERIEADEVVLSAGAYCSPTILMRSGIGPADQLAAHGIPVVIANEAVGANLRDHPFAALAFNATPEFEHTDPPLQTMLHLAMVGEEIDTLVVPWSVDPKLVGHLLQGLGERALIQCGVTVLRPYSTGRVELAGRDPEEAPRIANGFYSHPEDIARMVNGVRLARELMTQPALARFVGEEVIPGTEPGDDAALAAAIRAMPTSQNHPLGSCSMGPAGAGWAVVDQRGAVHGVAGLHVVDASIMPALPSTPPNLTTVMLAERCSDLLRAASGASSDST